MIPAYDDFVDYKFNPYLGHEVSREIPVYFDAQGRVEAYVNFFRLTDGTEKTMFHVRTFPLGSSMTGQTFKRFVRAIPAMNAILKHTGQPVYTFFEEDNDRRHKFALHLGWEHYGEALMHDGKVHQFYRYTKHLSDDAPATIEQG